jgi:nucleotide-binding universal stress UspA family protein
MSFRTVLVHVDASPQSELRVRAAAEFVKRQGVHLIGAAAEMLEPPVVDPMGGIVLNEWTEIQLDLIRENLGQAEKRFLKIADGISHEWRAAIDVPAMSLAAAASAADIVIVGPSEGGMRRSAARVPAVGDLLMTAGRPVLVLPHSATSIDFGSILIAWKDGREARRAVADALPFLKAAKQVTLVHVRESEAEDSSIARVTSYLERHEVECGVRMLEGGGADTELSDEAMREGTDLIVAGAYGHSRFREWVFGGVTRALLARSDVACLLSH